MKAVLLATHDAFWITQKDSHPNEGEQKETVGSFFYVEKEKRNRDTNNGKKRFKPVIYEMPRVL